MQNDPVMTTAYPTLFSPQKLGRHTLKNHICKGITLHCHLSEVRPEELPERSLQLRAAGVVPRGSDGRARRASIKSRRQTK
jgi:hypothetical protein